VYVECLHVSLSVMLGAQNSMPFRRSSAYTDGNTLF
jgi:hypothetical protein